MRQPENLEIEPQAEISAAPFAAGFQPCMGIAREIELCCFEGKEERRIIERAQPGAPLVKN